MKLPDTKSLPASESASRRSFLVGSGALLGSGWLGVLAGCSDDDDDGDAIWGPSGAATRIASSLGSVSQSSFPARDFVVTSYGARTCAVVAAVSPYTDATRSPPSAGSDKTHAPGSFDSRPAFLAAIAACNAGGGGRVVVP
jgi:polygalacturonase